jgi:hypothetical protein
MKITILFSDMEDRDNIQLSVKRATKGNAEPVTVRVEDDSATDPVAALIRMMEKEDAKYLEDALNACSEGV